MKDHAEIVFPGWVLPTEVCDVPNSYIGSPPRVADHKLLVESSPHETLHLNHSATKFFRQKTPVVQWVASAEICWRCHEDNSKSLLCVHLGINTDAIQCVGCGLRQPILACCHLLRFWSQLCTEAVSVHRMCLCAEIDGNLIVTCNRCELQYALRNILGSRISRRSGRDGKRVSRLYLAAIVIMVWLGAG